MQLFVFRFISYQERKTQTKDNVQSYTNLLSIYIFFQNFNLVCALFCKIIFSVFVTSGVLKPRKSYFKKATLHHVLTKPLMLMPGQDWLTLSHVPVLCLALKKCNVYKLKRGDCKNSLKNAKYAMSAMCSHIIWSFLLCQGTFIEHLNSYVIPSIVIQFAE